jgi:cupin fold WbuC family metalloprotein
MKPTVQGSAVQRPTVQKIDEALIAQTLARALASERRRAVHCFHPDDQANLHRFLNAFIRGTYCTPHRHLEPPKAEGIVVLRGRLAVVLFDDDGTVNEVITLDQNNVGIDLYPGVWHTLVALTDSAICYEVKPGPYVAETDKQFASWAPRETDPAASAYLAQLEAIVGLEPRAASS